MTSYTSDKQLTIEGFETPFYNNLLPTNRWVKLSQIVPWDKFASVYLSVMKIDKGRPSISPRIVLGALIIKHMENLDDRGVIAAIQENIYMQYFVGLSGFTTDPVFAPSLFVEIRKRIGNKEFDLLNVELIKSLSQQKDERHNKKNKKEDGEEPKNKGKMQADATVADQYITYPTDSGTLNECRKHLEKIIDRLYDLDGKQGVKPRTYRRNMNRAYLSYSKKRNKSKLIHRKMNRKLLECVKRNLKHIDNYLDQFELKNESFVLTRKEQHMMFVIREVYNQQKVMYDNNTHSHAHRIVNIYQPHVRVIPRGKAKAKTEFGSKLGVSLDAGFARIDTFSWDAYHEGKDLEKQVESYKKLHGHYPELVQVDKIYATRGNRKWLKKRGIRITAKAVGRPRKDLINQSNYHKRKLKKEATERNHIEGKFGQGKNGYNLNKIRAKLRETSESWVACIFFVMNLINYQKKSAAFSFLSQIGILIKNIVDVVCENLIGEQCRDTQPAIYLNYASTS
ncbi:MAG: IS5 family transposase [Chlorobi bacterium]|nr:IS5 family transposase [Chlorobiota bacterium]